MGGRVAVITGALLLLALGVSTALVRKARAATPLNLVYVTSNIGSVANMNSVFAWTNDGAGNLTPVNGSPYLTGGTGFYDPNFKTFSDEADKELIISPTTNRVFTVNANTNTVAVLNVNSDGSLTAVSGSPFASGGQEPLSLAISPGVLNGGLSVLTVDNMADDLNQVDGPANLNTLLVKANGALGTIPNSTVTLGVGANPTQVEAVNTAGSMVAAVQRGDGVTIAPTVFMYELAKNGTLRQQSTSSEAVGQALLGIAVDPIAPVMYVGYPTMTEYSIYKYNTGNGTLGFVKDIPAAGNALCWLAVNSAGSRLYTVEFQSGSVTVYDITHAGSPQELQHFLLSGSNNEPTNLAFDPTGNFLYVLSNVSLHVLNVSATDGTLSETVSPVTIPVPTGERPIGVATLSR